MTSEINYKATSEILKQMKLDFLHLEIYDEKFTHAD